MSGYFHADADEWEAEHYAGRWSATNRAPRWWASLDLAWMIDRRRLPSVRELAEAWGWTRSTVHDFLVANAEKHRAWDKRPEAQAWMADALPVRTVGGRLPPKSRGQKADTRAAYNAGNPEPDRTNDGQSPDTFRTVGGRLAGARSDPSPNDSTQHPAPTGEGEPEGASLTTPPTSDPAGSVPPADLTSAMEASDAPTTDLTPEHVNETNNGDRAEGGDVPRVASGSTVGLFGGKWAAALAPEPPPEPKPAPVETVKERNRRERAERAAALAVEVNTVWQAYAARHPHAGRRGPDGERLPSEADAHRIAGAVTEWGTADVLLLLDWAHDAPDDQARWLQGKSGRSEATYLGLGNLLVADKAGDRMRVARKWHAAGRPSEVARPLVVNGRHIRSIADDLRELHEWEESQRGSREVIDVH